MQAEIILQPDAVFDDGQLRHGAGLGMQDGRVFVVQHPPKGALVRRIDGIVSPGLVDLQVNGGGGVLFNTTPTPEGIAVILAAHRRFGTMALLPTVITDAPAVMRSAADAVLAAWGMPGLAGIHIEGPHISMAKRGTHDPAFIRPLGRETFEVVARLRDAGVPVLLTVAPEAALPDQIAQLARMGVVVSLGHSNATEAEVNNALSAGARNFTHLFNGMSQMEGRAPGMVGAALLSRADIGIICDGVHVSDAMIQLALRAHGAKFMHLVSDAMPTVGGPDHFYLYGAEIRVTRDADGARLVNAQGGLAGAHTTMAECVLRLVEKIGLPMQEALCMAISNPARVIGMGQMATIEGQAMQDVLIWRGSNMPVALPLNRPDRTWRV
ncbi:MAG: N-acetylglucosamine-6-phosphate deacetylase [Rhodobacteraceae bacterium]|nr:N-acetylglucosamine-6-phosphate deacetylase [Paracoccaceae bacterium]MCF8520979.1 N-acetylglucosamine-6-phosphate deacetylase [Paracoccaceae bacterium]